MTTVVSRRCHKLALFVRLPSTAKLVYIQSNEYTAYPETGPVTLQPATATQRSKSSLTNGVVPIYHGSTVADYSLLTMVGRVSPLPGLRRTPPVEDGRRAGCGKSARPVR
jgi:hypothetical protein